MTSHFVPILALVEFTSWQVVTLAIVGMGVGFVTLVSLTGIIVPAWTSVIKLRMETTLKQQLLDRGMSVEDILNIMGAPATGTNTMDYPCASEVVIEKDDEWNPGFILRRDGDRYYVHYVGEDMSENEWVSGARVRFSESSKNSGGSPWDWHEHSRAFDASVCRANTAKPAAVEQEI
jgi:hypothetical protein